MNNQHTEQNNTGLYFIVGILVAVVAVFGFIMFADDSAVTNIEPAAGYEESVDETSNSFDLNVDDEGVSGTTTTREAE